MTRCFVVPERPVLRSKSSQWLLRAIHATNRTILYRSLPACARVDQMSHENAIA